jgi:hypothetical protein
LEASDASGKLACRQQISAEFIVPLNIFIKTTGVFSDKRLLARTVMMLLSLRNAVAPMPVIAESR